MSVPSVSKITAFALIKFLPFKSGKEDINTSLVWAQNVSDELNSSQ